MRRYLVVANQTLGSDDLLAALRSAAAGGECAFHLVVPATPPREHLTWTEGEARSLAQARLEQALAALGAEGLAVTGEVGDGNPVLAVDDALRAGVYDEVIVSTFPVGISRWLRMSVPERLRRRVFLPVTHVVSMPQHTGP